MLLGTKLRQCTSLVNKKNIQIEFEDFQVLEKGFAKSLDRKIAEALYVNDYSPVLNGQKISYKLKLFN